MSCYDQINFKSFTEKQTNKLPNVKSNLSQSEFQKQFIDKYENINTKDLKEMIGLNKREKEVFDIYYKNKFINEDFFKEANEFNDNMSQEEKSEFIVEYLRKKYTLITPNILEQIFKEIDFNHGLNSNEFDDFIRLIFEKDVINLNLDKDKKGLKNLLLGREITAVDEEYTFPDVGKKKKIEDKEAMLA